jgi:hypothetical protein
VQAAVLARGSTKLVCLTSVEILIPCVGRDSYGSAAGGSAAIVGDTGLISYALDEELGAIGFVEELGSLRWVSDGWHSLYNVLFRWPHTLITMGSRVADAPVKSTAVAVNKDSREEDLPIMVDGM